MGRPSLQSPEREQRYLDALARGASQSAAAMAAGVTPSAIVLWRRKSPDFEERIRATLADTEIRMAEAVTEAAAVDWKAALAWLTHQRRDEWHTKQKSDVDITSGGLPVGGPVVRMERLTPEERRILLKALEREAAAALEAGEDADGGF